MSVVAARQAQKFAACADLHQPPGRANNTGKPADRDARADGLLEDDVVERGADQRAQREHDTVGHADNSACDSVWRRGGERRGDAVLVVFYYQLTTT